MTIVYCDATRCKHCQSGECAAESILVQPGPDGPACQEYEEEEEDDD